MDIYQIATAYWDQRSDIASYQASHTSSPTPSRPGETPAFDPQPEVPVPSVPEETPPRKKDMEPTPVKPELPPSEPVTPEVNPLPSPGISPDKPIF